LCSNDIRGLTSPDPTCEEWVSVTVTDMGVVEVSERDVFSPTQGVVLSRVEVSDGQARCAVAAGVSADLAEVIPLPMMGERVEVATEQGMVVGVWVQRITTPGSHLDERNGFVTALLVVGGELRQMRCQAGEWDARRTVREQPDPPLRDVLALLLAEQAASRDQLVTHEAWRDNLVAEAHDWATREDLCGRFDDFMSEMGLPGRSRDYSVAVEVTFTVYVSVSAVDAEDAEEMVSRQDVADAIRDRGDGDFEWSVEGAEAD